MCSKNDRYAVIMAGGVGVRFWPYSRERRPKQFLDFLGVGKTLLQMSFERLLPSVLQENILVVTNVRYRDLVLEQLPSLKPSQVLCEPVGRNTAPCIAYALAHLLSKAPQGGEMIVTSSDHLILQENVFTERIERGFAFVRKNDVLLTLGMEPTRAETGFGYIRKGAALSDDFYAVAQFTEKPDEVTAQAFLQSGEYLWNAGIFLWSLKAIKEAFEQYLPSLFSCFQTGKDIFGTSEEKAFIQDAFQRCESISVDYGILEKAHNVVTLPASFGWSDLGTWGSVYNLAQKDERGNVSLYGDADFYDSVGNIVALPEGHHAIIEGVNDLIIAQHDNALLVCTKRHEQAIKDYVKGIDKKYK